MELLEVMQKRRSVRTYTGEAVSEEDVTCILPHYHNFILYQISAAQHTPYIKKGDSPMNQNLSFYRIFYATALAGNISKAVQMFGPARKPQIQIFMF